MRSAHKSSIFFLCISISFFSCYALYKLIEASILALETNPEIDNVAAAALAMILAPLLLFVFNVVFYLVVFEKTIKKSKQISSWRILLLHKEHGRVNLVRVFLYVLCLWIVGAHIAMAPIWVVVTLVLSILAYGYWVLQIVSEKFLVE